ncbi:MAG: hypothetical protein HOO06_14595 [Bdellovibrionaceae bacterium]|jgi:hypothetical protein|nr:hypothetical protein [Pseudobdellovibrionaceae bacterium]
MASKKNKSNLDQVDLAKLFKNLNLIFIQPFVEIFHGLYSKRLPLYLCLSVSCFLQVIYFLGIDYLIIDYFGMAALYPMGSFHFFYKLFLVVWSPFLIWGFVQVGLKLRLIKRLTEVFLNAGLKSATSKLPAFIFDKPVDNYTRRLRVAKNGQSLKSFEGAKDSLESGLQVYIDEFSEDRRNNTVDIVYSHKQLEEHFDIKDFQEVHKNSFLIGKGRSKVLYGDLADTPHLLVAGQTGMGKSTFLRQFITSLYLNNKNYSFDLIDLKEGLEFQIFDKLPRVQVQSDVGSSINILKKLATKTIKERSELLKLNSCKDIDSFLKIPKNTRTYPEGVSQNIKLDRHVVVVDEAFDLFMAGPYADASSVKNSRQYASKIAAQGRAVGVHIVIATQRPDRFAVDPQTKANLTGKLCFRVPNIATSMTVMDSRRALDLPNIKGRAVWQNSSESFEVQTPFFGEDQAMEILKSSYINQKKEKNNSERSSDEIQGEEF